MGMDHRGRVLANNHANEIMWKDQSWVNGYYSPESFGIGGDGYNAVISGSDPSSPHARDKGLADDQGYRWRIEEAEYDHRFSDSPTDKQDSLVHWGSAPLTYRTQSRAMNAVQALVNRHAAGKPPYRRKSTGK